MDNKEEIKKEYKIKEKDVELLKKYLQKLNSESKDATNNN